MNDANSARQNVVAPLRRMGLIDDDGSLTDRGLKWRTEDGFGDACQEIVDEVYPDDLAHLVDGEGKPDRDAVRRWFDHKGYGASAAGQMTATFCMVAAKEVPEAPVATPSNGAKKTGGKKKANPKPASGSSAGKPATPNPTPPPPPPDPPATGGPSLHLDIQIHIPPDATPEQLDAIFASMAKHLYSR